MILNEFTKSELVKRSKDQGFNRYKTRLTIDQSEVRIDKVVIGTISSQSPHLDVYFKIRDYTTSIRLLNCMTRLRIFYSRSKYRNDLRKIITAAVKQSLSTSDILMNCTCPDFYYRFSYSATINHYGFNTNQSIPALIRNPENKGSGCKHLMRVINAPSLWLPKVVTAIHQVIRENPDLLEGV